MFRPAISPVFWCLFILVSVFGSLFGLALVAHYHGWHAALRFIPVGTLVGVTFAALWATLWAFLIRFFFPARISSDGVSAHSFWGVRRFLPWREVSRACPFRIFNLRFLRLYSTTDRKVTWLMMFPDDPDAFRSALHAVIPPNNPILTHIE